MKSDVKLRKATFDKTLIDGHNRQWNAFILFGMISEK